MYINTLSLDCVVIDILTITRIIISRWEMTALADTSWRFGTGDRDQKAKKLQLYWICIHTYTIAPFDFYYFYVLKISTHNQKLNKHVQDTNETQTACPFTWTQTEYFEICLHTCMVATIVIPTEYLNLAFVNKWPPPCTLHWYLNDFMHRFLALRVLHVFCPMVLCIRMPDDILGQWSVVVKIKSEGISLWIYTRRPPANQIGQGGAERRALKTRSKEGCVEQTFTRE